MDVVAKCRKIKELISKSLTQTVSEIYVEGICVNRDMDAPVL